MANDGRSIERLREYLKNLKPEARAMLIAELERSLLHGDESAGSGRVLQELRRLARAPEQSAPRIGEAARLFFAPLEPFLIDDRADHKHIGRIARVSLEPIWMWIGRDLIATEANELTKEIKRALTDGDRAKADQWVHTFHECAIQKMREAVKNVGNDEKARRRLAAQVGTPRAMDDLDTILSIFSLRFILADLPRRMPVHIRNFERDQVDHVRSVLDSAAAQTSLEIAGMRKPDVFLYGAIAVMNRLEAPWQVIRMATRAAGTDEVARIAETPYAVVVKVVLNDIECLVPMLHAELKAGRPVVSMLKDIHDTARGLRAEMNLSVDSPWTRQLAAMCSEVSNLLRPEIETIPGRVRRLLRPRLAADIVPGSRLDEVDVSEVEAKVDFVCACRHYAAGLALSEVTLRTFTELTQYLESATKLLLDSLRQAADEDRPYRQSQIDAAIRFTKTALGAEYAGLLAKAADVAAQTGAMARTAARA